MEVWDIFLSVLVPFLTGLRETQTYYNRPGNVVGFYSSIVQWDKIDAVRIQALFANIRHTSKLLLCHKFMIINVTHKSNEGNAKNKYQSLAFCIRKLRDSSLRFFF